MLNISIGPLTPIGSFGARVATLGKAVQWRNDNHRIWGRTRLLAGIAFGLVVVAALIAILFKQSATPATQPDAAAAGLESSGPSADSVLTGSKRFEVLLDNNLLTVRADQVRLEDLMREISRKAYVAIELADGLAEQRVSADFAHLPLAEGLREILAGYDVFTYHRGGKGLLTVWVYGELEGRALFPVPFETWASTADLQGRLEDPDAEERAAALEALVDRGGAVTEREVIKALDDPEEQIRTVALYEALNEGLDLPADKLIDLAANDGSHNVRFLALQNLEGRTAEGQAIEAALNDPNPVIRSYAEAAMLRVYPEPNPDDSLQLKDSDP